MNSEEKEIRGFLSKSDRNHFVYCLDGAQF